MKKEIIISFLFMIVISVLGFVQNKYFVQYMGMEVLGMMKLFSQLLAYINIIEMGVGGASAYALYKPLAEKDYNKTSIILCTMESIYNKIAIIIFLLGIVSMPLMKFFIDTINFTYEIYFYWILYISNTVLTYFFIKYQILFTANQEYLYVKTIQSINTIVFKILQIFFIIKYHSFYIYIMLLIGDTLLQFVFFFFHYKKNYLYIKKTKEKYSEIKKDIKNIFWHRVGGLVVFNTDLILISKFVSLEAVGIYASYQMILQIIETIIGILKSVLTPKIGKFISQNKKEDIYVSFKELNILFILLSIFFSHIAYVLIDKFVNLWLGKEFILSSLTTKLIFINLFISIFRKNLDMYKDGSGFFDDIKSPLYESFINLFVSIILGMRMGLDGIIIGTIVSNVIVILIYRPILVFKRCFNKNWKEYIKIYTNYLLLSVGSLLSLKIITIYLFNLTEIDSWLKWIIYATELSLISMLVLFVIFLINQDYRNILKKYFKIKY